MASQSKRRPKRSGCCLKTLVVAVCLQGLFFLLYHQVSLPDFGLATPLTTSATGASFALAESLQQFLSSTGENSTIHSENDSAKKGQKASNGGTQAIITQPRLTTATGSNQPRVEVLRNVEQKRPVNETTLFDATSRQVDAVVAASMSNATTTGAENSNRNAHTMMNEAERLANSTVQGGNHSSTVSTNLPEWFQEYREWHRQQRASLTRDNWKSRRYLVMQCLESDDRCGGTADRLKPIPTLLFMAHQYNRILLIRWQRPARLEEFLLPPSNGIDWRVPDYMEDHLGEEPVGRSAKAIVSMLHRGDEMVVRSRYQTNNGGSEYYNEHAPGASFEESYHDIWHEVFEPVPAVADKIQQTMDRLGLSPGNYAASHLRALYAVKSRPQHVIERWAVNAVNCASKLRPGGPIYFASDSSHAVLVVQAYAKSHARNIVSLIHEKEPLHLEKANHTGRHASEYYDTFVDLYLLGMSRCISLNVGGFGKWGLLLSYDWTCHYDHSGRSTNSIHLCNWTDALSDNNTMTSASR